MQIDYELTQKDFIDSVATHRNRNFYGKWLMRLLLVFALLVGVTLAFGLIVRPNSQDTRNLMPFFGIILLWIGVEWGLPWLSARRQFLKQPGAQGQRTVLIDASGVHQRWSGGSSDIVWKNFVRSLEGKKQFLLYTSPASFDIIPKRALTSEGLLELRALLKQNIPA